MPRVLTTLAHLSSERLRERGQHDTAASLPWGETDFVDPDEHSTIGLIRELLRRAPRYDVVILNTSGRRDQITAAFLRRLRPKLALVLNDCAWKVESFGPARAVTRLGIRLIDGPRTHYCVFSATEQELFPRTWGVDPERVHVTHWYFWLSVEEAAMPVSRDGFVFSGGDSMRDYRPLVAAARDLDVEVRVAALEAPPVDEAELPTNVIWGPLSFEDYFRTMCRSSAVVMPLAAGSERSAGQQSYLNPMAKSKLVIVNDTTGVREYLTDRETALIVPNDDPTALANAVRWALDPANAESVRAIGERAQRDVSERFPLKRYVGRLIEVAEGAVST